MLISIIMPAYNAEKFIEDSILSVINQTWADWELLIIDDCSTDRTRDIIKNYTAQEARIFSLNNSTNCGVAYSRNKGIREAHGDWIAFLDSDDLWAPNKLSLQTKLIKQTNAQFTFTGSCFIDEYGNRLSYTLHVPEKITFKKLLKQNLISCSSVLICKDLLLSHPMKGGNLHEDFATWLSILKEMDIAAYAVDEPALIYRIHSDSKSSRKWKAAIMNWNVYREIKLNIGSCCYYQINYALRNILKYVKILISVKTDHS